MVGTRQDKAGCSPAWGAMVGTRQDEAGRSAAWGAMVGTRQGEAGVQDVPPHGACGFKGPQDGLQDCPLWHTEEEKTEVLVGPHGAMGLMEDLPAPCDMEKVVVLEGMSLTVCRSFIVLPGTGWRVSHKSLSKLNFTAGRSIPVGSRNATYIPAWMVDTGNSQPPLAASLFRFPNCCLVTPVED